MSHYKIIFYLIDEKKSENYVLDNIKKMLNKPSKSWEKQKIKYLDKRISIRDWGTKDQMIHEFCSKDSHTGKTKIVLVLTKEMYPVL